MSRQNVSSIVRGAGLAASIWTALDRAVQKRGGIDEDLHRLATPAGEDLIGRIADLIVEAGKPKTCSRVIATFTITCGGRKVSELIKLGKYDWANDWIGDQRFPIQPHPPVMRTIEFIECEYDPTSDEVLGELGRHGLKRPTYEDALQFGVEHPEEQRKRLHIFLHEPVLVPDGDRCVLALSGHAGYRYLSLRWFGRRWARGDVFAGVRED